MSIPANNSPHDAPDLVAVKPSALANDQLASTNKPVKNRPNGEMIHSPSGRMKGVADQIEKYAPHDEPVFLLGKTGTGKEVVARSLHKHSPRFEKGPFVAVNCAGFNANLIESELFGHEKGAFTGAVGQRIGAFERAERGTLFLDEITEMPIELQAKLLRAVNDQEIMRVGGNGTIKTDVRIIAATNRNPFAAIREGKLRRDLFYRLNVLDIKLPRLRDRPEDIRLLVDDLAKKAAQKLLLPKPEFSEDAIIALSKYHWPGNVRQLESKIKRVMIENPGRSVTAELLDLPTTFVDRLKARQAGNDVMRSAKEIKTDIRDLFKEALNIPPDGHLNIAQIARDSKLSRMQLTSLLNPDSESDKKFGMQTKQPLCKYLNDIDIMRVGQGKAWSRLAGRFGDLFDELYDVQHPQTQPSGHSH